MRINRIDVNPEHVTHQAEPCHSLGFLVLSLELKDIRLKK